jgi:hypothetical protein
MMNFEKLSGLIFFWDLFSLEDLFIYLFIENLLTASVFHRTHIVCMRVCTELCQYFNTSTLQACMHTLKDCVRFIPKRNGIY